MSYHNFLQLYKSEATEIRKLSSCAAEVILNQSLHNSDQEVSCYVKFPPNATTHPIMCSARQAAVTFTPFLGHQMTKK